MTELRWLGRRRSCRSCAPSHSWRRSTGRASCLRSAAAGARLPGPLAVAVTMVHSGGGAFIPGGTRQTLDLDVHHGLATKPIISLRRSSSKPFSTNGFRVILSIVMVRSRGCVWMFATRANRDSDHDSSPSPVPLWTPWGKGFKGVALRSALGASLRATPSYTTPRDANSQR